MDSSELHYLLFKNPNLQSPIFNRKFDVQFMNNRTALLYLLAFLALSCTNQRKVAEDSAHNLPACCGNFDTYELNRKRMYQPVSIIEIVYVIKGADTLEMNELFLTDSIKFTQAFKDIKVSELCVETGYQGKTYYGIDINHLGDFEKFEILRKIDSCFDSFDKKVESTLIQMKPISKEFYATKIIFFHEFRLI
mgnify:CR=1 FL=1